MSCQAEDLLKFAEALVDSDKEPELRASISRAYYAAFHVAKEYDAHLPLISKEHKSGGTHKQLIDRFVHENADKRLKAIGYILKDMCNRREFADYHLLDNVISGNAKYQVGAAKRAIQKLIEYSDSLNPEKDSA